MRDDATVLQPRILSLDMKRPPVVLNVVVEPKERRGQSIHERQFKNLAHSLEFRALHVPEPAQPNGTHMPRATSPLFCGWHSLGPRAKAVRKRELAWPPANPWQPKTHRARWQRRPMFAYRAEAISVTSGAQSNPSTLQMRPLQAQPLIHTQ
jgi:hypothetical protein